VTRPLILVDLLFFTGKKGGMESYIREIYSRMPRENSGVQFIATRRANSPPATQHGFPAT